MWRWFVFIIAESTQLVLTYLYSEKIFFVSVAPSYYLLLKSGAKPRPFVSLINQQQFRLPPTLCQDRLEDMYLSTVTSAILIELTYYTTSYLLTHTMLCVLILYMVDRQIDFFKKLFLGKFYLLSEFLPEICYEEIAEKKIFFFNISF